MITPMSAVLRQQPGEQRAEQDREERAHLDQRVAADQLRCRAALRAAGRTSPARRTSSACPS